MTKYILTQMRRSKLLNAAFCVLLALAGTLLCIGAGLLFSAWSGLRYVNENFTTIAVLNSHAIRNRALHQLESRNINEYVMGQQVVSRYDLTLGIRFNEIVANYMQSETLLTVDGNIFRSGEVDMDTRRIFGAYSPGVIPFFDSHMLIPGNGGSAIAFIGSVASIEELPQMGVFRDNVTGEPRVGARAKGIVRFDVEELISVHHSIIQFEFRLRALERIYMLLHVQDMDGGYFFAEGGRYFVSGAFDFHRKKHHPNTFHIYHRPAVRAYDWFAPQNTYQTAVGYVESFDMMGLIPRRMINYFGIRLTQDDLPIELWATQASNENILPAGVFALGDMDLEEALASDIGDKLRSVIRTVTVGMYQLNIITTSNVYSILPFNQRRANIIDGRVFTQDEYESGAKVALVPRLLADTNQLSVGDTINLSIFEGEVRNYAWGHYTRYGDMRRMWMTGGFRPGMWKTEPMTFEIVGIYESRRPTHWEFDPHIIPLNTLIIPDNALANLPVDEIDPRILRAKAPVVDTPDTIIRLHDLPSALAPMLNMVIIPNGEEAAFRETIFNLMPGYAGLFRIYDQGYSFMRPAMENMLSNTTFIFALCLAGWLLAVIVFCLFYVSRKKKEAGLLYALGIRKKDRFRWVFMQIVIVVITAQIIAFGVSTAFYEQILDFAVNASFAQVPETTAFSDGNITVEGAQRELDVLRDPLAIPLGVGVSAVALLISAGVMVKSMVKSDPQTLRGAEG